MGNLFTNFSKEMINDQECQPQLNMKNTWLKIFYSATLIIVTNALDAEPIRVYRFYRGRWVIENSIRTIKSLLNSKTFMTSNYIGAKGRNILHSLSHNVGQYLIWKYPVKVDGSSTTFSDIQRMLNEMRITYIDGIGIVEFKSQDAENLFNRVKGTNLKNKMMLGPAQTNTLGNGGNPESGKNNLNLFAGIFTKLSQKNIKKIKESGIISIFKDHIKSLTKGV